MIAVLFPIKLFLLLIKNKNQLIVASMATFASLFYFVIFYSSIIEKINDETVCGIDSEWLEFMNHFLMIDSILTILLPFVCITICNSLIIIKLTMTKFKTPIGNEIYAKDRHMNVYQSVSTRQMRRRVTKSTKILVTISCVFLALNFPIAVFKIWDLKEYRNYYYTLADSVKENCLVRPNCSIHLVRVIESEDTVLTIKSESFRAIALNVYYMHFSINFFLFSFNKSELRNIFKRFKTIWNHNKSNNENRRFNKS